MHDLPQFLQFQKRYFLKRLMSFGRGFERFKDVIVAFLIVKRGRYSNSFLNTSFLLLVGAAFIAGPTIAENNPFINGINQNQANYAAADVEYNPYESSLSTVVSEKGRDKVITYTVRSGETLASIAKQFNISIDTIRWANSTVKNDAIKPGDKLQIPPITGIVHKVKPGENIYTIAKKYKTDPQNIVNFPFNDFNDLTTFSLTPGQSLIVPNGVIEEQQNAPTYRQQYSQVVAGVKGSSNFIWPTNGIITQYPIWYHMALDIANPSQPPVIASDTGTVTYSGCTAWDYGCHVVIDHGNGYQTLYGHLSYIAVSAGQVVSQGQNIGTMGSTGRSTGTHLHFEIRQGETLLNPLNFLK